VGHGRGVDRLVREGGEIGVGLRMWKTRSACSVQSTVEGANEQEIAFISYSGDRRLP